jgi:hypothetical protein
MHHTAHTWYVSAVAGFDGSASMKRPVGDVHSRLMLLIGCHDSMPGAAHGSVNSGWMADLQHRKRRIRFRVSGVMRCYKPHAGRCARQREQRMSSKSAAWKARQAQQGQPTASLQRSNEPGSMAGAAQGSVDSRYNADRQLRHKSVWQTTT